MLASDKLLKRVKQISNVQLAEIIAVCIVVGLIGYALIVSNAAGAFLAIEAEQGFGSGVTVVNDTSASGGKGIQFGAAPIPTPTATPTPTPGASGTTISNAFTTGYGWPDNSPPGNVTSGPVGHAGGTGTYADPITLAVGYVGSTPDYPYGTKFYIPNVRKYFVVEDTCAACHKTPAGASTWVDMWAGGNGSNDAAVLACENTVTGNHTIIRNPDSSRVVVAGALYNGSACASQYGG